MGLLCDYHGITMGLQWEYCGCPRDYRVAADEEDVTGAVRWDSSVIAMGLL